MIEKFKNFAKKCKNIKGFEIICALVIAVIAIGIYFSVNAVNTRQEDSPTVSAGDGKIVTSIKNLLSQIDGVGECDVLVTYKPADGENTADGMDATDNVQGVVVVAQGGQDVLVRIKIINALCTLLNIQADDIQIFEKK